MSMAKCEKIESNGLYAMEFIKRRVWLNQYAQVKV